MSNSNELIVTLEIRAFVAAYGIDEMANVIGDESR